MSWNGSIPMPCTKSKGVRNKRNKKSPKAIIAMKNRQAKRAKKSSYGDSDGRPRHDASSFDS